MIILQVSTCSRISCVNNDRKYVCTVPSSTGVHQGRGGRGRAVVVLFAPQNEPTPPPADLFVPSRDGVLALIRDELRILQSQLILENSPLPMPNVVGGPQSGELTF